MGSVARASRDATAQVPMPKTDKPSISLGTAFELGKGNAANSAKFLGWKRIGAGLMSATWSDGTVVYRDKMHRTLVATKGATEQT